MTADDPTCLNLDFGFALKRLKAGARIARTSWNGKGMWLTLVRPYLRPSDPTDGNKYFVKLDVTAFTPAAQIKDVLDRQDAAFGAPPAPGNRTVRVGDILYGQKKWEPRFPGDSAGSSLALLPWIGMKTADDCFVPWLASQADLLAEDWMVIS